MKKTALHSKASASWLVGAVGLGLVWATPSTPSTNEVLASTMVAVMEQELYLEQVEQTGSPFDVAVLGPGFLVVETKEGVRYSRGGSLKLTDSGVLTTEQGLPLLSVEGKPITIERGNVQIDADGVVIDATGAVGQLQLVRIIPQEIEQDSNRLYHALPEQVRPALPDEAWVYQGFLQNESQNEFGVSRLMDEWGSDE
ncbi:MAG: hypothetical protein HQL60_02815 [Magnetococcales bacterium]|nr:hypothetical protein [Magnetococcales bacterium]